MQQFEDLETAKLHFLLNVHFGYDWGIEDNWSPKIGNESSPCGGGGAPIFVIIIYTWFCS